MSDTEEAVIEERRVKRIKRDTSYKAKAFEKFKQLKDGKRNKYEEEEIDNVYDLVEEKEYVKKVLNRQDGWIVDDDGSGYVEDGREIFDDDMDPESVAKALSSKQSVKRKKKMVSDTSTTSQKSLQFMLSNMPQKKKEDAKIDGDEALAELLNEIDQVPSTSSKRPQKAFVPRAQIAQNYMKSLSLPVIQKSTITTNKKKDEEMDIDDSLPSCSKPTENQNSIEQCSKTTKHDDDIIEPENRDNDMSITEAATDCFDNLSDEFEENINFDEIDKIELQALKTFEPQDNESTINSLPVLDANSSAPQTPTTYSEPEEFKSTKNSNNIHFYWYDIFEDFQKQRGKVFLFGKMFDRKTGNYISCCVTVTNIERQIFVLPRPYMLNEYGAVTDEEVSLKHVYSEFKTDIMDVMGIKFFKHRFVSKKYAFDPAIPKESDYMEVRYPAAETYIDPKLIQKRYRSFSKIFGVFTSGTELFLLDRKIKGPCWLELTNSTFTSNPLSWCSAEIICPSMNDICKIDCDTVPPLTVVTLNVRYHHNPETDQDELLMISCLAKKDYQFNKSQPNPPFDYHFCVFTAPKKHPMPTDLYKYLCNYKGTQLQKLDSEKAVLNYFLKQFVKMDCDVVVGYDLLGYVKKLLAKRLHSLNVQYTSKLSRLRRSEKLMYLEKYLFTGRLVCDIKISAIEFIHARDYDLGSLCQIILKIQPEQRCDFEQDEILKMYSQSGDIIKLVAYTMQDTGYILKIFYDLNIIPLCVQITKLAGNVLSKTLMGGRSERNEYLLMHAFSEKGYIVPDTKYSKYQISEESTKRTAAYAGGLVLDPKVGFYDKLILLMDFNSLYPSIIQEYNICYSTIEFPTNLVINNDTVLAQADPNTPTGILPAEIRRLVEMRRQVKRLMKNPDLSPETYKDYDVRQLALKLTANSMYGCLGFSNSRFYAKHLAALVTQKGREILTNTKDIVEKMGYDVVYGDTDSIMINTKLQDYDEVIRMGNKIKQEINKLYKQIELDIDGIFKYLLLLKKKKYAALTLKKLPNGELQENIEYKGLDIVRRDWSQLASETGKYILSHILSDQSPDDRLNNICSYLAKIKNDILENNVPLPLFAIAKQITKDLETYANADTMPHVQVALRCNKEHGCHYRAGDIIKYIICLDGTNRGQTQRAYHVDELKMLPHLKIDTEYYLTQQILPVIKRITGPLSDISVSELAQCLGVENYAPAKAIEDAKQRRTPDSGTAPVLKFKNVDNFKFKCRSCNTENVIKGPLNGNDMPVLQQCTNSECRIRPVDYLYYISNELTMSIRSYIRKYYKSKIICEDPACLYEAKRIPSKFIGKHPVCPVCSGAVMHRAYEAKDLNLQLNYFYNMFDLNQLSKKPPMDELTVLGYQKLLKLVDDQRSRSSYSVIDIPSLFTTTYNRDKDTVEIPTDYVPDYVDRNQFIYSDEDS